MKRAATIVCLCAGTVFAIAAFAQPGTNNKGGDAKTPAGMPDMKAMQQAMTEAATPGDMQKYLTSHAGTWEGKCKMWMDPSAPPQESTCTSTITGFMGGRFTKNETHGTMVGVDGKPGDFEGFGLYGYNNTTKQFESTWCDTMGTMQMHLTGKLSDDKKVLTWEAKYFCPIMHQDTWMHEVETYTGPDAMTLEFYSPDPSGKNTEFKMMQIDFTRKSGMGEHKTKPATR